MKTAHLLLFLLGFSLLGNTQDKNLLGTQPISALKEPPYAEWFTKGYEAYQSNSVLSADLTKLNKKNLTFKVFFGSWCGDTKRELPKFLKTLHEAGFSKNQVELIGVDNANVAYKQSPNHEEKGWNIYRVPTFIVLEKGIEIGRIIEYPAFSFERDLSLILSKQPYKPNYQSYGLIAKWLTDGILSDKNINIRGLANQLHGIVKQDSELNALGYVLLGQNKNKEAITVLQTNAQLFPKVANCYDSLAEAYLIDNQKEMALAYYEYALKLDPTNKHIQESIDNIKKISKEAERIIRGTN